MTAHYFLDTSVFLNGWTKYYLPDVFPGVWAAIDNALSNEIALSCRDVYDEIIHKDDSVAAWAKQRSHFFAEASEECLLKLREVMAAFPNYVAAGGSKNKADPMIVAHALVTNTAIVTDEHPQPKCSPKKSPKLPLVCEHFDIDWLTPCEFLRSIGARFK